MSTTNPFGKLKVEREESSDEEFKEIKENKVVKPQESKKKKKVRPQQQEQEKEKEKNLSDDQEGFEEVNKHQKKNYQREKSDYEEYEKKDYYSKKVKKDYQKDDSKPNKKREFERKSGTGRGKEISKGGAGGKGTWGNNPKEISRRYEKNSDDYFFEQALNPKPKRERRDRNYYEKKYEKKNENNENNEDNDKNDKNENNDNVDDKNENNDKGDNNENVDEKKNENEEKNEKENYNKKKKKEKKVDNKEIKKEDLLNRPENAMSLDDYLKSQVYEKEDEKVVEKPKDTEKLTIKETDKTNEIGVSEVHKKKDKKIKEKKEGNEFSDVYDNLQVEGYSQGRGRGKGRGRGRGGYQKKEKTEAFHFDPKDFPKI